MLPSPICRPSVWQVRRVDLGSDVWFAATETDGGTDSTDSQPTRKNPGRFLDLVSVFA